MGSSFHAEITVAHCRDILQFVVDFTEVLWSGFVHEAVRKARCVRNGLQWHIYLSTRNARFIFSIIAAVYVNYLIVV